MRYTFFSLRIIIMDNITLIILYKKNWQHDIKKKEICFFLNNNDEWFSILIPNSELVISYNILLDGYVRNLWNTSFKMR